MSYFKFSEDDIVNTTLTTHPYYKVELNGNQVTGSVYLEKSYLDLDLEERIYKGFSQKRGGYIEQEGPFTASVDLIDAISGSTNSELWHSVKNYLYSEYLIYNSNYTPNYTGSLSTTFRVISIPEIYYDSQILTGSFTASDIDSSGDARYLYDDGRGGIYSGSLSGTLVGNIFYEEGLVVLKKGDLSNFGEDSSTNHKWSVEFKGVHKIPVKIFKCRAPSGKLNASTNPSFYTEETIRRLQGHEKENF